MHTTAITSEGKTTSPAELLTAIILDKPADVGSVVEGDDDSSLKEGIDIVGGQGPKSVRLLFVSLPSATPSSRFRFDVLFYIRM